MKKQLGYIAACTMVGVLTAVGLMSLTSRQTAASTNRCLPPNPMVVGVGSDGLLHAVNDEIYACSGQMVAVATNSTLPNGVTVTLDDQVAPVTHSLLPTAPANYVPFSVTHTGNFSIKFIVHAAGYADYDPHVIIMGQ